MAIVDISGQPIRGARIDLTSPLARGLVGYWPMLEGTGDTLHDYSGFGNHGALTNMDPATDWVAGKHGKALEFDGTDNKVACNDAMFTQSDMSAAFWMRLDGWGGGGQGRVFDTASHWWRAKSDGAFYVTCNSGAQEAISATGAIALGSWCHIAVARHSGTGGPASIYINGQVSSTPLQNSGTPGSLSDLTVGGRLGDNLRQLDGQLEGLAVFHRILSPSEIATLYADPWALFAPRTITLEEEQPPTPSDKTVIRIKSQPIRGATVDKTSSLARGLVGYWPMLEGTGDTLHDYSGRGRTAIFGSGFDAAADWRAYRHGKLCQINNTEFPPDYATVSGAGASGASSAPFTVSAWTVPATLQATFGGVWIRAQSPSSNHGAMIVAGKAANKWLAYGYYAGWASVASDDTIALGRLYHLVMRYDGATITMFVDGKLQSGSSARAAIDYGTAPVEKIGHYNGGDVYNGGIGQVARWDRALSPAEVSQLYADPWALFAPRTITLEEEQPPTPSDKTVVRIKSQPIRGAQVDKTSSLARGLVGYWPMLEGTGNVLSDYSGYGNHGTLDSTVSWDQDTRGPALLFDPANTAVEILHSDELNITPPFTIFLDVGPWSGLANDVMVEKNGNNGFSVQTLSGGITCNVGSAAASDSVRSNSQWNDASQHLFVITSTDIGGDTARLYVDGIDDTDATYRGTGSPSYGTNTPVYIGSRNGVAPFGGKIARLGLLRRALSPSEVATLYSDPWSLFAPRTITIPTVEVADITATNAYGSDSVSFDWTVNPA